jgi:hypothetical protein
MAKTMNQKHLELMNDPEYAKHFQVSKAAKSGPR